MTVLNDKDSDLLETVRKWAQTDAATYYKVANKALNDLEQRTKDLNTLMAPARGFKITGGYPAPLGSPAPGNTVTMQPGVLMSGTTIVQHSGATSGTISPTSGPGNYRIDLMWFDKTTQTLQKESGAEAASFGAAVRPSIPSLGNHGAIPLAYLYIDDGTVELTTEATPGTAGYIEDIRPATGAGMSIFDGVAGSFLQDLDGGAAGSSGLAAHSDHRHPLNVDGTVPDQLDADKAAAVGTAVVYARRDHVHDLSMEASAAVLQADVAGGAVGTSANLVRADHQHPPNVDNVDPEDISSVASSGTSTVYARRDHVHVGLVLGPRWTSLEALASFSPQVSVDSTSSLSLGKLYKVVIFHAFSPTNNDIAVRVNDGTGVQIGATDYSYTAQLVDASGVPEVAVDGSAAQIVLVGQNTPEPNSLIRSFSGEVFFLQEGSGRWRCWWQGAYGHNDTHSAYVAGSGFFRLNTNTVTAIQFLAAGGGGLSLSSRLYRWEEV
jgi:hypothetical protein